MHHNTEVDIGILAFYTLEINALKIFAEENMQLKVIK